MKVRCVVVLALIGLVVPTLGAAQESPAAERDMARNGMYLEVLGSGLLYSLNYDRRFSDSFTARIGYGGIGRAGAVPLTANYLAGRGNHRLELGIGPVFVFAPDDLEDEFSDVSGSLSGTAILGYRYQPIAGGWLFRAALTPLFSEGGFLPWVGLSVGRAF